MIKDTGPTTDNHQQSFCSVQTNVSPNHFRTINSIYELHSIINQLSIDKQKSNIALSSAIKNYNNQLAKMKEEIERLKQTNNEIVRGYEYYKKQVEQWKAKCDKVIKEKNQLQKILDRAPMIQNKMSINLLISEYEKLKRQEQQWNKQLQDASFQIKSLQSLLLQGKAENNSLRNNLEHQAILMGMRLQQQRNVYSIDLNQLKNQHQLQKQKMNQTILRVQKQKQQIQAQNNQLNTKVQQIRKAMNDQYKLYIQNQLLQLNSPIDSTVSEEKYNQLKRQHNQLIDQKNEILAQFKIRTNQLSKLKQIIENYVGQIKLLEERLNEKTFLQHQMKDFYQLKTIQILRTQPSDHLAKLEEISFVNSKEKKQLLSQIQMLKRKNNNYEQRLQQLNKCQQKSKQRINFQQTTMQKLQNSNYVLNEKVDQLQKINRKLKTENDQLAYQCQQLKLELRRNQSRINENNDVTKISAQKYHSLMEGISILGEEKNRLMKQNVSIKSQLQNAQNQIIKAVKCKNQLQYQMRNKIRLIQTLQAKNQQLTQFTLKLKNKLEKLANQHNQEVKQLQSKMNVLNECVDKLRSERINQQLAMSKFQPKKKKNFVWQNVFDFKIKPTIQQKSQQITTKNLNRVKQMIKTEKMKESSFTTNIQNVKQQGNLNNLPLNLGGTLQQIKYRQRSQSDRIRIDRVRDIRMPKIDNQDQKLNKMINQLKKQNRQLSKGHFT